MAYKEVATLDADVTIALGGRDKKTGKANPTKVEGYYLGRREVAAGKFSRPGKQDYLYFLQTPKGNVGVWGKTDLDRKLAQVTPGDMIRVSHTGMRPTPSGEMHTYKVEVDSDNRIDVSGLQASAPSSAFDDASELNEDESLNNDTYGDEDEAPTASIASSSAAERKAKVDALLNKNRAKN